MIIRRGTCLPTLIHALTHKPTQGTELLMVMVANMSTLLVWMELIININLPLWYRPCFLGHIGKWGDKRGRKERRTPHLRVFDLGDNINPNTVQLSHQRPQCVFSFFSAADNKICAWYVVGYMFDFELANHATDLCIVKRTSHKKSQSPHFRFPLFLFITSTVSRTAQELPIYISATCG